MNELKKEIDFHKLSEVNLDDKTKMERKELLDKLLDSVSGGWVNAFGNWEKSF